MYCNVVSINSVSFGMMVFVIGLMIMSLLGKDIYTCIVNMYLYVINSLPYYYPTVGNPFLLSQLYVYVKPLVYVLSLLPPFHLVCELDH